MSPYCVELYLDSAQVAFEVVENYSVQLDIFRFHLIII